VTTSEKRYLGEFDESCEDEDDAIFTLDEVDD